MGLEFSFSRGEIQQLYSSIVSKSGGGKNILALGWVNYWEKYFFENVSIHFLYTKGKDKLEQITLELLL